MVLTLSYAEHDGYLLDVFNNYFEKGSFMDVQFICKGNKIIFAHKLVVASVSSLVRKLIVEMPCKDELMTIYLPDVNCNILNLFLTFLYEGVMKLDAAELEYFKEVCNLLCVEIPDAEISEVCRESVSPPTVPPSLAQRLERMSSHTTTHPKKTVIQSAHTKSNGSEVCYQSVVVKQENDAREITNHSGSNATFIANTGRVQTKQETEEEIDNSNTLVAPEIVPGTQNMHAAQTAEKVHGASKGPQDCSECCTIDDDVVSLAISNVVSLSGAPTRSQGQKRTRAAKPIAKPNKKAKHSLVSAME